MTDSSVSEPRSPWLLQALEPPSYGYTRNGALYVPSRTELVREFFSRFNLATTRKNWLPVWSWFCTVLLFVPLVVFATTFFSWKLAILGFVYSMVGLGTHGTVYLHRYSTHRAFRFRNAFTRFVLKNLVLKIVIEEAYVVSHHVHHLISEKPGDPYNVNGGGLYCFLADVNHQLVARNLDERGYAKLSNLLGHTGIYRNTYAEYQRWGSVCHPAYTVANFVLSWAFWYGAFYLMGGHALATALFGSASVWAIGVRTFNFAGHGSGADQRQDGIDLYRVDKSVNQLWPGFVAGEWHNNHHSYPKGARSGFLWYQLDSAWFVIWLYWCLGGIVSVIDPKEAFFRDYYDPWRAERARKLASSSSS